MMLEIEDFIEQSQKTSFHPFFKAHLYNEKMQLLKFAKVQLQDAMFACLSILFVFCFLIYHLKSFFLASTGMSLIIFSFPISQIICEGVLEVTYVGVLHAMVVFIVLGIGADDIFVFIDGWR